MICLSKLRIENNRLYIDVESKNKIKKLYFEVEDAYKNFFCTELYDSFLVSLIPYAVKHEEDIKVEGAISSKLFYQLTTYLIPMLCKAFGKRIININTSTREIKYNGNGVGASISCGVDSFYTLLKHKEQFEEKYNITHLTFFNAGSNGEYGGDDARKLYKKRVEYVRRYCEQNNYSFVTIDTNINEYLMMNHEKTHAFRTLGCVLALQKLFSKYYFASGWMFDGSHIDEEDTAYYDILNVHCLSTENIDIYCSGLEVSRLEKIKYISNYPETYKWLNVCVRDEYNCGECEKCIRTMAGLDSIGKLELYKDVFDLKKYKKNKVYSSLLKYNRDKVKRIFTQEIIDEYKKHGNSISNLYTLIGSLSVKEIVKLILPKRIKQMIKKKLRRDMINSGWSD